MASTHFIYEVGYNVDSSKVTFTPYEIDHGQHCFKEYNTIYNFKAPNTGVSLSKQFLVSLDDGFYAKKDSFEQLVYVKSDKELCVLWGSWMPNKNEKKYAAQFYFNIITGVYDKTLRYLYFFHSIVDAKKMETDLKLDILI